jgi:methyl-accepting chemotaxis protein
MKILYSLKFQFITLFSVFIIIISVVTALLNSKQLSTAVEETFAEQGIYIVERAASLVDGDAFEALDKSQDINDPFYESARLKLLDLKNATGCLYLYTIAPYNGDTWRYIIDGSAEPDDTENFSALGSEENVSGFDPAFKRVLQTHMTETAQLEHQETWGWVVSVYAPIKNSAGRVVGIVGCDFSGEKLYKIIKSSEKQNLIVGIVSLVLGMVLLVFFLYRIFTPLYLFDKILEEISLGEGDLTKRIVIDNQNEIGKLAKNFNRTLEKIKGLVIKIKEEAAILEDTGRELATNMNVTATAINQITANIQDIEGRIINQSAGVTETHATMEQVVKNINNLNTHIENQNNHITQASASIEQMVANINSVTGAIVNNAENVVTLTDASEAGRTGLSAISTDIQEIVKESEGLIEINAVMENISSQTNLLSMNAAIEAAHAGEAGKGFAVVAGEIRKLAESASNQSKTIGDVLKRIKNSIDKIRNTTANVIEKFEAIDKSVKTVSQQEENIRNAMEEQGSGSKLLLEGVSGINQITRQVTVDSNEMHTSAKEVIRESKNLEMETQEITRGMNEMASGANQINLAVKHVSEISIKNREGIDSLISEVAKFKVE